MTAPRRWAAIPAQRSSASLLQIKLRLVLALLLVAAVSGPIALVVGLARSGSSSSTTAPANHLAEAYGAQVVRDYLTGAGTSLPVANDLDATFARPDQPVTLQVAAVDFAGVTVATVDGLYVETYTYVARLASGRLLRVAVPLSFTTEGPLLVATPSLLSSSALASRTIGSELLDWDRIDGVSNSTPAAAQTVIGEWVQAYAANDGAALQRITGDQDPAARYLGLGGINVLEVKTLNTFPRGERYSVVRVRVLFSFAGVDGYRSATEFDLLVLDPALPNPRVQAWGPAGSGPTLEPYQNNTNRT
jgi:hypothetical protein